ncbi:MAG: hypothetical protein R2695_19245 [Acidimicrobiales bacterium]
MSKPPVHTQLGSRWAEVVTTTRSPARSHPMGVDPAAGAGIDVGTPAGAASPPSVVGSAAEGEIPAARTSRVTVETRIRRGR